MAIANTYEASERRIDNGREMTSDTNSVRALTRAMSILRCFDIDHPEWSLRDLTRATGLNKTTVYRLVKTMEAAGFLCQKEASGEWYLGPGLMPIGYVTLSYAQLVRIAHPHVVALAARTGETVDLMVWTSEGALCVDQVLTSRPLRPVGSVGRLFTDLANSNSKVFLAFMSEERQAEVLARPIKPMTPNTIVDARVLREQIERVRVEGIAYDLEERAIGICGIGAPVRDFRGEVVASLSVIGASERFGPSEIEQHARALRESAHALSLDLGYRPG